MAKKDRDRGDDEIPEERPENPDSTINRRGFLAASGVVALGVVGSTVSGNSEPSGDVVGYGYGGEPVVGQTESATSRPTTASDADGAVAASTLLTAESESNDRRTDANLIETGTAIQGTLSESEVDWYGFNASRNTEITATLERSSEFGVVALVFYDPSGGFINQVYVTTSESVELSDTTVVDGTHYVQVFDIDNGSADYTLTVETGGDSSDDTTISDDYGTQNYGQYGYGGVSSQLTT